jgi:hypothetical protein
MYLEKVQAKEISAHQISWTAINNQVADRLQICCDQVTRFQQLLFEENTVGIFGDSAEGTRGRGSPASKNSHNKLTNEQLKSLVNEVDECHSQGATVNCTIMKNYIDNKFYVEVHTTTIAKYF